MRILLSLLFTFLFCFNASAIEFEDAVYPELITSSRGLAMGNAYNAKVDDAHSAFYNPAGLGSVRHTHFHLLNLHAESNDDYFDMAGSGSGGDSIAKNMGKSFKLDGVRQLLKDNPGKLSHARVHTFPNITLRHFTLGYLVSKRTRATIADTPGAKFEYADRFDHGPVLAGNLSLGGGVVKIGGTAVFLKRTEAIGEAPANNSFDLADSDYNKGSMLHVTGGAKITLPIPLLPTFSGTIRNVGSNRFTHDGGPSAPEKIKQTIDAGFSLTPQFGKTVKLHLEANMKDTGSKYSVPSSRRLTFGAELDIARIMFFRGGYGDGFGSGGIGFRTRHFEIDLTTYAVDSSSNSFRGKEDRRFVFSFSSGF